MKRRTAFGLLACLFLPLLGAGVAEFRSADLAAPLARANPAERPSSSPEAASGPIGGYTDAVSSVAVGVESNGRIHVLWLGQPNSDLDQFLFYSSSADGKTWTPAQRLGYGLLFDARIAVDDARHRAHLVWRDNSRGIVHRMVDNGVLAATTNLVGTGGATAPSLAVDSATGRAYLAWHEAHSVQLDRTTQSWRYRLRVATWDGSVWAEQRVVNSQDTNNALFAAGPNGKAMLAWFQDWSVSVGTGLDAGQPTILRSADTANGLDFSLRQAVGGGFPTPQKDNSFLLTYSPADDHFYLLANHLMWPGHSVLYRYVWSGNWSAPLEVSGNKLGWAVPVFAGGAASGSAVHYVYKEGSQVLWRGETGGALAAPRDLGQLLASAGIASGLAYFVDGSGGLNVVGQRADGGLMYYRVP